MRKIRLELDDLNVEGFETEAAALQQNGTVDAYTGVISGCLGCEPTADCTGNWHDLYCHDSVHFCDPTYQFTSCAENC